MAKEKKTIDEQVKNTNPEFYEEVLGLSVEELDARLAALVKDAEASVDAMEADEELQSLKAALKADRETKKELEGPYKDALKAIRLKSRFIISLVKEKGGK